MSLGAEQRDAIAGLLKEILSEMQGLDANAARAAIDDLENRVGARVVERGTDSSARSRPVSWWGRLRTRPRDRQESRRPG